MNTIHNQISMEEKNNTRVCIEMDANTWQKYVNVHI